jgi:hypothetical protein
MPAASTPSHYDRYFDIAKLRQGIPNPLFDQPDYVKTISAGDSVCVVAFGDTHIGAEGTDYDALLSDIEQLRAAKTLLGESLVIVGMGDYIDGYLSQGTPRSFQVLSPREQRAAAEDMLRHLRPSFVLEGDHDLWHSNNELGHAWLFDLCVAEGFQYSQWGGTMTFLTPNGPIRGLVRHRYKGSVATDHLRPHKALHLDLGPADFTMLAHWHSHPGVYRTFSKRRHEGTFFAVQSGTYKRTDEYAKKLAGYVGHHGVPALVVRADGTIVPFDRFQDALVAMV